MTSIASLNILVVEDDADTRDILELVLAQSGASVRVAGSAGEGHAAIQEQAPDVILADLSLPDEDGCAFIAAVRAGPSTQAVPAVALTGHVDSESKKRALAAGFQIVVHKPYDMDALAQMIFELVQATTASAEPVAEPGAQPPSTGGGIPQLAGGH